MAVNIDKIFPNPMLHIYNAKPKEVDLIMNDTQLLNWIQKHNPLISRSNQLWRVVINANIWHVGKTLREALQGCANKLMEK